MRFIFLAAAAVLLLVTGQTGCTDMEETVPSDNGSGSHAAAADGAPRLNRLAGEKSPYLLQHADNPIDWYPWGQEAFSRAEREDRPIFLSIGYSACHWCHVMEEESFRDHDVADYLNRHFVAVKVDREERPDVDNIYMTACQAMTGSGGWPLTIVMTARGHPFFAGTYFPRQSKYGRPGLLDILKQIIALWEGDRDRLVKTGQQMAGALDRLAASSQPGELSEEILEKGYQQLAGRFDDVHGGFGEAPKFPTPHNLSLLLRRWRRGGQPRALEMVQRTLDGMWCGGMYDHVGFGFHRYSTDAAWLVPHFEKMLYDQALLTLVYLEAYQAAGEERYARVAREIITYVLRDMTSPEGGFYSAEDADSEGREGKYYVWTRDEVISILGGERGDLFCRFYGVTAEGSFEDGASVLHRSSALESFAAEEKISARQLQRSLEMARQKLLGARRKRVAPRKDDKILTDWNGLMIAALARGAAVLDDAEYSRAAARAADFLLESLRVPSGDLLHRYRQGEAGLNGYADDYAFLVWGLIELYEATFQVRYLREALTLTDRMVELFWDRQAGGLFFTGTDAEELLARSKEAYDGAVPSGNSVAALNLLRLSRLTGKSELEERAHDIMRAFGGQVAGAPGGFSHLLMAADFALGPAQEVVIAGDPADEVTRQMLAALRGRFLPSVVVLLHPEGREAEAIGELVPFLRGQTRVDGMATAYVCRNFACQIPVTAAEAMLELIEKAK
jgi:uncharacterized protein YyaL (SSP411 family)